MSLLNLIDHARFLTWGGIRILLQTSIPAILGILIAHRLSKRSPFLGITVIRLIYFVMIMAIGLSLIRDYSQQYKEIKTRTQRTFLFRKPLISMQYRELPENTDTDPVHLKLEMEPLEEQTLSAPENTAQQIAAPITSRPKYPEAPQKAIESDQNIPHEYNGWDIFYLCAAGAWIIMVFVGLHKLLSMLIKVFHYRRKSTPLPSELSNLHSKNYAIRTCQELKSPAVSGVFRPMILLPKNMPFTIDNNLFTHEITHIQNHDYAWNIVARLLCALLPFQPLLGLLHRKMVQYEEEYCDDQVLVQTKDKKEYAMQLLKLAKSMTGEQTLYPAMASSHSGLRNRIERILTGKNSPRPCSRLMLWSIRSLSIPVMLAMVILSTNMISLAGENEKQYQLSNECMTIQIQPSTLAVDLLKNEKNKTMLSAPFAKAKRTANLQYAGNKISWNYPQDKLTVNIELMDRYLKVRMKADKPGTFSWPNIREEKEMKAFLWPNQEGKYLPLSETFGRRYLTKNSWDTLEGLTIPFWGIQYQDQVITWVIHNRYYNEIVFTDEESKSLSSTYTHEFPDNQSSKAYGFDIYLSNTTDPTEPAHIYRNYLKETGQFKTMKEKIKEVNRVERLAGAFQVYLWGDGLITAADIRDPKSKWKTVWQDFARQFDSDRQKVHPASSIYNSFNKEQKAAVKEACGLKRPYKYLQNMITEGISKRLKNSDFYQEEEWKDIQIPQNLQKKLALLKEQKLQRPEIAALNCDLFHILYSEYTLEPASWGDGISIEMIKNVKNAGFDRMRFCGDGAHSNELKPEVAAYADKEGYLFGIYDSFHSIHDPKLKGTDSSWETAQFSQELYDTGGIMKKDGTMKKGFKQRGYILNSKAARKEVERRVSDNFSKVPYSYYFVDCDAFGHLFDDYTPGREMTQEEDGLERCRRMNWISKTYGVPIGSEGGCSFAASTIHVAEGIVIPHFGWGDKDMQDKKSPYYLGAYYPPNEPGIFFRQTRVKDVYYKSIFDPGYRLPLYEIVFHDSVITTNHWQSGNMKYPELRSVMELTQLLYQTPPMYHLNRKTFRKQQKRIKQFYDIFSPLHRETAVQPMTSFEYLSRNRMVQRTVFEDYQITVNFGDKPFLVKGLKLQPKSAYIENLKTKTTKTYIPQP